MVAQMYAAVEGSAAASPVTEVGDALPDLAVEVRDDGTLADATTVVLTITLPDETTTEPTVTNPTTGKYEASYVTTQAGRHLARWVATGTNASAYAQVYDIRDSAPGYIVSLQEAKTHLNMTATDRDRDEELRGWIEATTEVVERQVGSVVVRSHTQRHDSARRLILQHTPVVSLTSVTPWLTTGTTYTVADLKVNATTGIVERKNGLAFTGGPFSVVYKAGRTKMPANITRAALIIIQHLWETQRGGARSPSMGGDDTVMTPMGFAVPARAMELLAPHKLAQWMA